jgi:DNA polymerase-1
MVIIVDGNQLACRCYFSITSKNGGRNILTSKDGQRTETIYAFLSSFRKIVRTYKDENSTFFLTWDGGNDRRKAVYPQYKAGRKKFEDAFYEQLDEIRKIIKLLGIKQYHFSKVEADDIIGTLTVKSRKKGQKVLIVSSDHDFEQLITRHVKVYHPAGDFVKDEQYVLETYGISPNRLTEIMAITGDSTDNIPGIDKVGDKTAAKLILANGSLAYMLNNVDDIKILNKKGESVPAKDDLKEKIKNNVDNIRISHQLVKIVCDLDLEPDFSRQQTNFETAFEIFKKLDFEQFTNEFTQWKECFDDRARRDC